MKDWELILNKGKKRVYKLNICRECSNNIGEVAQVALTRDGLVTELREKCKEVASDEY